MHVGIRSQTNIRIKVEIDVPHAELAHELGHLRHDIVTCS